MSQENVEAMRRGIEAMNRRDIDSVVLGMHPEIRFEHRLAALQGSFVGVDVGTIHAIGTASRAETAFPLSVVARYNDGLLTEFIDYGDTAEALEAAGLSE